MIERRPRAPVLRLSARPATTFKASSVKVSLTPSISNRRAYCLTKAFFGFVRISDQDGFIEVIQSSRPPANAR